MTRDEYEEDSCQDEPESNWLVAGYIVVLGFAAWAVWMYCSGCIYKPTINVLPIDSGRTDTLAVRRTQPAASAPATSRPWTVEELEQRLRESE